MNRQKKAYEFAQEVVEEELSYTGVSIERIRDIRPGGANEDHTAIRCRDWVIKRMFDAGFCVKEISGVLNRGRTSVYRRIEEFKKNGIQKPAKSIAPVVMRRKRLFEQPQAVIARRVETTAQRYIEEMEWLTEGEKKCYRKVLEDALWWGIKQDRNNDKSK